MAINLSIIFGVKNSLLDAESLVDFTLPLDGDVPHVSADPTADQSPNTIGVSNKALKASRSASRSSLDFVTKVWVQNDKHRACLSLRRLSEPFYKEFGERAQGDHTDWRTMTNAIDYANGAVFDTMNETFLAFESEELCIYE